MVESEGIEPSFSPCKGLTLPLDDDPIVGQAGVDPAITEVAAFTVRWSCRFPTDPYISFKMYCFYIKIAVGAGFEPAVRNFFRTSD